MQLLLVNANQVMNDSEYEPKVALKLRGNKAEIMNAGSKTNKLA